MIHWMEICIHWVLAIWSLVPLPFLKPAWTSGSSWFMYCWSLAWRILSITSTWDECNCAVVWTFFGIFFFGIGMKTDLFQSCGHCRVFQICWHIECSTFTASPFRVWNSSAGILPSPPLALFVVMLPRAHLTLHSGMSVSKWVITPSWLSRILRYFLCVVLLCILATSSWYLLLLLGPYNFCPLLSPPLHGMFPWCL